MRGINSGMPIYNLLALYLEDFMDLGRISQRTFSLCRLGLLFVKQTHKVENGITFELLVYWWQPNPTNEDLLSAWIYNQSTLFIIVWKYPCPPIAPFRKEPGFRVGFQFLNRNKKAIAIIRVNWSNWLIFSAEDDFWCEGVDTIGAND